MEFYYPEPTKPAPIDAGLVAASETVVITRDEWCSASTEELESLSELPLYPNQRYHVEHDIRTGNTLVHVHYRTPCITTLEEQK